MTFVFKHYRTSLDQQLSRNKHQNIQDVGPRSFEVSQYADLEHKLHMNEDPQLAEWLTGLWVGVSPNLRRCDDDAPLAC